MAVDVRILMSAYLHFRTLSVEAVGKFWSADFVRFKIGISGAKATRMKSISTFIVIRASLRHGQSDLCDVVRQ